MANTKQNNPKSFAKNKFSKENHPKSDPDCALGVHSASNQHNERRYEFYWGYKSHVLVDCMGDSFFSSFILWTPPSSYHSGKTLVGVFGHRCPLWNNFPEFARFLSEGHNCSSVE